MPDKAPAAAWATWGLGFVLPLALIALILIADAVESPKTAYVGVLAVVPMLAAVFATPSVTALVALITWLSGWAFGQIASDGNVTAQTVRLIIIAISGLTAVGAASLRVRREHALATAQRAADRAAELKVRASTDELTGLTNRFGLTSAIDSAPVGVDRAIALVDCGNLKTVNDRYGHLMGDEYLQAIAGRIAHALPKSDLVARWGGDEFLIVQDRPASEALPAFERVLQAVSAAPLHLSESDVQASISTGVADWRAGSDFDAALSAADDALYEAKARGRGRIVVAGGTAPTIPE